MIEYKATQSNDEIFQNGPICAVQNDEKLSLTQLWEFIVRTKRLPDGSDVTILYSSVREKLRDPEREVRQHTLRVLIDLIPVTDTQSLDDHMRSLLPNLLSNLGHPAPALRKGVLDTLRIYLSHSRNSDRLLRDLISSSVVKDNILAAAPFLVSSATSDETLTHILESLWVELSEQGYRQEAAAKSLARIRYILGDERFKLLFGLERFAKLQSLCDSYGLPIDYSDEDISEGEEVMQIEEVEDKVILETEITLRTGPAITMKIHEESRSGSRQDNAESDDDASQKMGVIKVLEDDSDPDIYEAARRTPRKVRFGGESVKMRTPESDSNQEDGASTLRITVTDAVSIKTRKSLIPIRITSLPSTPKKQALFVKPRLHQSTPNLSRNNNKSKIPMRKGSLLKKETPVAAADAATSPKNQEDSSEKLYLNLTPPPTRKKGRGDDVLSPVPIHNEIEVIHNLTRSPEFKRKRKSPPATEFTEENEKSATYDSFQVVPKCLDAFDEKGSEYVMKSSHSVVTENTEQKEEIGYNSFQVCPENCNVIEEKMSETKEESSQPVENKMSLHQPLQIYSFSTEDELCNKSEALDNLIRMLKQPNTCEGLEPGPAALLFEALFACQHLDILHFLADDALALLVNGLRPRVLEQCLGRVALGICKMGAPSGVSLALMIMKKCPANKMQLEIIEKCFSHRTREGALQILMAAARLLPSGDIEVVKITEFAAAALRDRRRRVRHAALETLASLAQLASNAEVLDIVDRICETSQDRQYLLRVVRTRLSRRQLPIVEMDGKIRYSTPRDQTEVEWLSGVNIPASPPSCTTSSSTPPVNYWRHNSRHEDNALNLPQQSSQDDTSNGNQQIWAVDSSVFPKNGISKETKSNSIKLQPIYILQPEAVRLGERDHRRYDRGRSFSPSKPVRAPFRDAVGAGSAPNNEKVSSNDDLDSRQQQTRFPEGFRKSFSSEQLYRSEKPQPHHEPYSFSLSSRSSTTSTGSSTRSGNWQRDMRSGIPVPISSETKLRIRTTTTSTSITVGPVIARRTGKVVDISGLSVRSTPVVAVTLPPETLVKSALGSPVHHTTSPLPSRDNGSAIHASHPPTSSGSESSGYFTPPPETQQAFVKLDTEEHASESEEIPHGNDDNNNSQDCVDSFNNNSPNVFLGQNTVQRNFSSSSIETSDPIDEKEPHIEPELEKGNLESNNNSQEREETRLLRFSSSSVKEPSFSGTGNRIKSKSVVDLKSFLPDISTSRKTVNSAPPLNDELLIKTNVVITSLEHLPLSPMKIMLPNTVEPSCETVQKLESPKEETGTTKRLTKRFARTNSRKSIKSTPRSVRETTPITSRLSSKPKEALQIALAQLNSNEWEVMIQGLQSLERLTKENPDIIESQIHNVCVAMARQIKNLRSQVARSACHTASELFLICKKGLDMELEEIAGPLLHRTADTNKFLRADANAALDVMCAHLPVHRIITVVTGKGCTHQNCIVRSTSIRLINDIVKRLGAERVFQMQKEIKDKILLAGANALTDGSLEARSYAKVMFSHLISHPQFHRSLLDAVPQSTLRHIAKTLSSIKPQIT